jgi:hypothetical protein
MSMLTALSIPVATIKALADLLEKLMSAPQKRRKLRFDQFFKPLHESFQEVHVDYTTMLRTLVKSLPLRENDGTLSVEYGSRSIDELESARIVREGKLEFERSREKRESVRDWLRSNAQAILTHVREPAERRYLYLLMIYFLPDDHFEYSDDQALELRIDEIVAEGGTKMMDTPTTKLSREIRGRLDADEIRTATATAISELNQRCSDVIRAYVALSADVISKTA